MARCEAPESREGDRRFGLPPHERRPPSSLAETFRTARNRYSGAHLPGRASGGTSAVGFHRSSWPSTTRPSGRTRLTARRRTTPLSPQEMRAAAMMSQDQRLQDIHRRRTSVAEGVSAQLVVTESFPVGADRPRSTGTAASRSRAEQLCDIRAPSIRAIAPLSSPTGAHTGAQPLCTAWLTRISPVLKAAGCASVPWVRIPVPPIAARRALRAWARSHRRPPG